MAVITPTIKGAGFRRFVPRISGMTVLTTFVVLILVYLLVVPLTMQFITAFRGPVTSLPFEASAVTTLDNMKDVYTSGGMFETVRDTLFFVGGSVLVAFVIGFAFAWLVERTDVPGRNILFVLIIIPAIMPGIVRAQAWLLMLAPKTGIINEMIRAVLPFWDRGPIDPFTFYGMILVQGLGNVTFFFLLLSAVLRNMDGGLEEASRASGATMFQTIRRVTVPILLPGIVAVVMLNFIITLGQFEVPLLFGISAGANIFSLRIFLALTSQAFGLPLYGEAAAYGVNFLILTYVIFFFYSKVTRQANKYATITGKGYRPTRLRLGRWKWAVLALFPLYLIITFVIPMFALFWSSLFSFFVPVTWDNFNNVADYSSYSEVLDDPQFWGGLWRTFAVSAMSATVAVSIAMVTAWVVVRGKRNFVNRALDLFASSSVAIPATVAAFAFFMFYIVIGRWVPVYGTIWILVLAYSFRTSVAYRNTYAGVVQINKELEEASMASGASQLSTFRRIMVPLLLPHAFVAWLILFLLASHEFTIAIFLSDQDSNTLPVVLFNRLSTSGGGSAQPDQAAAMAIIFTLLVAVITFVVRGIASSRGVRAAEA